MKRIVRLAFGLGLALAMAGCYQFFDWDHVKRMGHSIKRDLDEFNEATDRYFFGYDPADPYQQYELDR